MLVNEVRGVLSACSAREVLLLSQLYLSRDFPKSFLVLEDVAGFLGVSRATAGGLVKGLEERGLLVRVRSFSVFVYCVDDVVLRRAVLDRVGFFK